VLSRRRRPCRIAGMLVHPHSAIGWAGSFHFELPAVQLEEFANNIRNARTPAPPVRPADRDDSQDVQKIRRKVQRCSLHPSFGCSSSFRLRAIRWSSRHISTHNKGDQQFNNTLMKLAPSYRPHQGSDGTLSYGSGRTINDDMPSC
jgi:hypothetical protein